MLQGILAGLGAWSWLILGAALMALEIFAPGTFFLWFGLSAVLTGLVAFVVPMPWQVELVLFAGLALVSLVYGRRYFNTQSNVSDRPFLNERAQGLVGKSYILKEPIKAGRGRLHIGDSVWRIEGPDLPKGSSVKVTKTDGSTLSVIESENSVES
jgi:membrane protein implicated in regulation of membrane protease activity